MPKAIKDGKFREDLYYRLNTVPIIVPSLRSRPEDIVLLFRKFARDFAEKYRMPTIRLTEDAMKVLVNYRWPGNIRQLKNTTEQISVIEQNREITPEILQNYVPIDSHGLLPAIYNKEENEEKSFKNEREILYQVLFDMKKDMHDLKQLVHEIIDKGDIDVQGLPKEKASILNQMYRSGHEIAPGEGNQQEYKPEVLNMPQEAYNIEDTEEYVEESLSLSDKEIELIKKALDKHNGKRKYAAMDLGISERTLYRKIKEYDIR